MRWEGRAGSENVEDRRGMGGGRMALGGGGLLVVIIGAIFSLMMGRAPQQVVQDVGQQLRQQNAQGAAGASDALIEQQRELEQFSKVVLADTEVVWNKLLPEQLGKSYQEPTLVLFTGYVQSACGGASAAVGPFYCPGDMKVYLDLSFFEEMQTKFKAPGDFACAYVIAHEVGHHVQNLLGLSMEVQRAQQRVSKVEANNLSVRLELQADFLAGVWARHAQDSMQILEKGDLAEAINAAQQIGDDTLQKNATGRIVPDAFTHGSSEQRIRWFTYGLETGDLSKMDLLFEMDYDKL